ncbi:unannotated protein [freshwater metagenome]|uniref:Unannotated protein n=1 Tax=freshwater metagenome TaxID=449393 RepID=A0A6J6WKU8_9ZZZZ
MSTNLGPKTIFKRGNDAAAVGVVLWVCRGNEHHIYWQADLVSTNLHITLFENIQQTYLNTLSEVWQLVNRKDSAVGARHHAVVNREFIREVATLSNLDRVNLTDQVSDGGIWSGELLPKAAAAVHPCNWGLVPLLLDQCARVRTYWGIGIIVDLAPGNNRHPLVKELSQGSDDAGLGLAALS